MISSGSSSSVASKNAAPRTSFYADGMLPFRKIDPVTLMEQREQFLDARPQLAAADDGGKSVKQKQTFCRFTGQSLLLLKNQRAKPRAGQSIGKVRGRIRPLLAPAVINDAVPLARESTPSGAISLRRRRKIKTDKSSQPLTQHPTTVIYTSRCQQSHWTAPDNLISSRRRPLNSSKLSAK